MSIDVALSRSVPRTADAVAHPVAASGPVPRALGLSRVALAAHGFEGKRGQVLVVPTGEGATQIAIGIGDAATLDVAALRNAAAQAVRAAGSRTSLATSLADLPGVEAGAAAQAVTEGALLAAYRYHGLKNDPPKATLQTVTLVVGEARSSKAAAGVARGQATSAAAALARDLANTPPAHLMPRHIAERAVAVAAEAGLTVEVFNKDQLQAMGCGGMIGVNRGSTEPPRRPSPRARCSPPTATTA